MRFVRSILSAFLLSSALAPFGRAADDLADLVEKIEPAVVRIETERTIGSGVIIDASGRMLTNYHVIDGIQNGKLTVVLRNGDKHTVKAYVDADRGKDLALLDGITGLSVPRPLPIAAGLPRKGEKVAAFGNPMGFAFSASEGIVSGIRTGKEVNDLLGVVDPVGIGRDPSATWVQTTAAISGGNSGGPLVNMNGEVVGINSWTRLNAQNLNFAISADDIRKFLSLAPDAARPLPRSPGIIAGDKEKSKDFKLRFPSGRVFSFEMFVVDIGQFQRTIKANDETVLLNHPSGAVYAMAKHHGGVLQGPTIALYENKQPMAYATYMEGRRHGLVKAWSEANEPVVFSQYIRGRRQGFTCFFDEGVLKLIVEYERDQPRTIQMMNDHIQVQAFNNRADAEKEKTAKALLEKLDELDKQMKDNEVAFRKQIAADVEQQRRQRAAQLGVKKRADSLHRISRQDSSNEKFLRDVRALTGL